MRQLSSAGQQLVNNIAQRHGFSADATQSMLFSVVNGNGSMAQFNHPEFGGSGQWMQGGMTMLSDMFNGFLKNRVDNLCSELSNLVANQPDLLQRGSFQSQSQSGAGGVAQQQASGGLWQSPQDSGNASSLFVPPPPDWWGTELRWPNSTGAQNGVRYAYFAQARRLAIEVHGTVTVYDTLDHQIGGFSQQQSYDGSLGFNSQYGLMDVSRLPVVSVNGIAPYVPPAQGPAAPEWPTPQAQASNQSPVADAAEIMNILERLTALHGKGVLTESEYQSKKADLLARL